MTTCPTHSISIMRSSSWNEYIVLPVEVLKSCSGYTSGEPRTYRNGGSRLMGWSPASLWRRIMTKKSFWEHGLATGPRLDSVRRAIQRVSECIIRCGWLFSNFCPVRSEISALISHSRPFRVNHPKANLGLGSVVQLSRVSNLNSGDVCNNRDNRAPEIERENSAAYSRRTYKFKNKTVKSYERCSEKWMDRPKMIKKFWPLLCLSVFSVSI